MNMRSLVKVLWVGSLVLCASGSFLSAAEKPLAGKDFVLAGDQKLVLNKRSTLTIQPAGIVLTPYLKTDRWRGFYSAKTEIKPLSSGKDQVWKYQASIPAKSAPVIFETAMACPKNASAVQYSISWKIKDPKDCAELFLYLQLPESQYKGKDLIFNGKKVPAVTGDNKWAWHKQTGPLELTLFPGEKGKSLTFKSKAPVRISCETHKAGKRIWIRIYPVGKAQSIHFDITSE